MRHVETEIKWSVQTARAFNKMLLAVKQIAGTAQLTAPHLLHITDTYIDHADGRFEREQLAFRVRHYGTIWEATFKTRTALIDGKAVRREETQYLTGVKNISQALAFLQAQKRWKGLVLEQLHPLFTIKNKRIVRQIQWRSVCAELAFDTCVICAGKHTQQLKEIELELKHGRRAQFEQLAAKISAQCNLPRATVSKVKTAVLLLRKGANNDCVG